MPDLGELMRSAYLEDKPLYLLQCAMEENCLAGEVTMRSPWGHLNILTSAIQRRPTRSGRPARTGSS